MKTAKIVRILTLPQIMAFALLTILFFTGNAVEFTLSHYILGVVFLTVLPLVAYPIAWAFGKKSDSHSRERTFAIIFCIAGYIGSVVMSVFFGGNAYEQAVFLCYLFSGILTALLSFVFKRKSSGHAGGVSGVITVLAHHFGLWALFGLAVLAAAYWCSLKLKRHDLPQLLCGTAVPIVSYIISLLIAGII